MVDQLGPFQVISLLLLLAQSLLDGPSASLGFLVIDGRVDDLEVTVVLRYPGWRGRVQRGARAGLTGFTLLRRAIQHQGPVAMDRLGVMGASWVWVASSLMTPAPRIT